jgi:hypothetical protein
MKIFLLCLWISVSDSFCPFHPTTTSSKNLHDSKSTSSFSVATEELTPLQGQLPITSNTSDPYVRTNDYFRSSYSETKSKLLPKVKILHESDYLILILGNGSRYMEPIVTNLFHNLKMISHLPVTIYVLLLPNVTQSLQINQETLTSLITFQNLMKNVTITSDRFPDEEQYQRQLRIYDYCYAFLTMVIEQQLCSFETLTQFTWDISVDINLNLDDAAENSINLIHQAVMNWKSKILTTEEWNDLYVATLGRSCPSSSLLSSH